MTEADREAGKVPPLAGEAFMLANQGKQQCNHAIGAFCTRTVTFYAYIPSDFISTRLFSVV
jgi:hypothetical protein